MYFISKIVARITEYKAATQHASTGDCAIPADITPLLTSDIVRIRDPFCYDTAFMNLIAGPPFVIFTPKHNFF